MRPFVRPWWWWATFLGLYFVLLVMGALNVRPTSRCAVTEKNPAGCAVKLGPAAEKFLAK